MANASNYAQHYDDEEEEDDDDEFDDDDDEPTLSGASEEDRLEAVLRRLTADEVRIRVHDVAIRGCARTRRAAAEAALGTDIARAATVPELLRAAAAAGERLRRLGAFESVSITLDAVPPGILPAGGSGGAVVVLVDVAEARGGAAGGLGVFADPEARSCSVEGSLKLKNLFGYCETWDVSGALGLDQTMELSAGVAVPRIGAIPTPLMARMSFLSKNTCRWVFLLACCTTGTGTTRPDAPIEDVAEELLFLVLVLDPWGLKSLVLHPFRADLLLPAAALGYGGGGGGA